MAKKYQRRKKRKTKKQAISRKYWIFASLGLLVAALSAFIYHEKIHIKTSYSVSEIATVNPGEDTLLYPYLFKVQTKKITSVTNLAVEGYLLTSYKGEQITFAKVRYENKLYYIKANQLKITQSNSINAYIASLNYPHEQIDNQINNAFAKKAYATSNAKPKGVLIHDTDNDRSDINDEINYMAKNYQTQGIFVHAFIDNTRIVQIADNQYMAQGAGPKANPYYIQFEMTRLTDADSLLMPPTTLPICSINISSPSHLPAKMARAVFGHMHWLLNILGEPIIRILRSIGRPPVKITSAQTMD